MRDRLDRRSANLSKLERRRLNMMPDKKDRGENQLGLGNFEGFAPDQSLKHAQKEMHMTRNNYTVPAHASTPVTVLQDLTEGKSFEAEAYELLGRAHGCKDAIDELKAQLRLAKAEVAVARIELSLIRKAQALEDAETALEVIAPELRDAA